MAGGGILALDLATSTGWAYAPPEAIAAWPRLPLPVPPRSTPGLLSGTKVLRFNEALSHGHFYSQFFDWLTDLLIVHTPAAAVFEAPIPRSGKAGIEAGRKGLGLSAVTDMALHWRGIDATEVAVNTVRLHFVGSGNLPSEEAKRQVQAACRARGWRYRTDDESDALAVLDYAVHTHPLARRLAA